MSTLRDDEIQTSPTMDERPDPRADADGDDTDTTDGDSTDGDATDADADDSDSA